MDPTGIFFLYVIASPQAECQARVNVNATHGTKTRVAYVSLHLMGSSRSIYPAGITIGISRWYLAYSSTRVHVHTAVVPSSNNTSFDVLMPRFLAARENNSMHRTKLHAPTTSEFPERNFPGHVDRGPARSGYAKLIGSS